MRRIAGPLMAIAFAVLLGGLFALFHTDETHAVTTVPTKMNFQGRLTDSAGNIKPDGLYNMKFRIFTQTSGGTDVWNETREQAFRVQVTNGLFSVRLGDVTPLPVNIFSNQLSLWLEIELPTPATATCSTASCASFTEGAMTPRNQLATSAYAFNADTVDGIDSDALAQLAASNTFTGINLFKPSSNSTSAFRVQNAAGSNLLAVDSTNAGGVTLLGNNSGETGSWQTNSNVMPVGLSDFTSVTANGYIYAIGGGSGVYYAKLNADGSVGSWTTSGNSLPAARFGATAVTANGYVYVIGGAGPNDTTYYAKLNAADGSVGAWQTSPNVLPITNGVGDATSVYANGYIYVMGGLNGSVQQAIYYAKVNADGSIGSWITEATNILPTTGRYRATSVYANGYVYVIGGPFGGSDVSYAQLNANGAGSVGTWTNVSGSLPAIREDATSVVSNGYVYIIGGSANSGTTGNNTVYYAKLNANGSLGSWSTSTNTIPAARCRSASVIANGYAYVLGGNPGGSSDCGNTTNATTVYYARVGGTVQIGGNLDLVGLQGQNLADGGSSSAGSTGGSITAGNITGVGSLQIQGAANFADNVSVAGNVSAGGLSIQNSVGIGLLSTDNVNSLVYIGNPTADSTGALLVLDGKNTSGDPTGFNGAMYYNSATQAFRCYENNAWTNCTGGLAAHDAFWVRPGGGSSTNAWSGVGFPLASNAGASWAANLQSEAGYTQVTTGTTAANEGGFGSAAYAQLRRSYNPVCTMYTRSHTATNTGFRVWIGLFTATPPNLDAPTSGSSIGFRYSSVAGDTGWRAVTNNAASSTVSAGNVSGVTIANTTAYKLRIRVDSAANTAYFSVNDGAETSINTNLPTTTASLGVAAKVINTDGTNADTWNFGRFYCEFP